MKKVLFLLLLLSCLTSFAAESKRTYITLYSYVEHTYKLENSNKKENILFTCAMRLEKKVPYTPEIKARLLELFELKVKERQKLMKVKASKFTETKASELYHFGSSKDQSVFEKGVEKTAKAVKIKIKMNYRDLLLHDKKTARGSKK